MEHETKFDEDTKKLIKAFRAKIANGQYTSRTTLLAYSFLKRRPYVALENKINEDHESFGIGRDTFLTDLAYDVGREIFRISGAEMQHKIHMWIMEKYEPAAAIAEDKAA
ncbi:hypothetical protein M0R72_02945 [Candidatus Pacearchaeota archaeon]|jgi:hypothetical protein|nr:hypothetical protein [Candidatus Pacearchaeota archaeon]